MPRTKEFDPDQVLEKAMQIFWMKGYEATTVQDLVDAMGINRFSIYSTFGNKRQLFLKALDHYCDQVISGAFEILEKYEEGAGAIRKFFMAILEFNRSKHGSHGCFVVNSTVELAPHDDTTANRIKEHLDRLESAFSKALTYEFKNRPHEDKKNIQDISRFLSGALLGLGVMAKGAPGWEVLESYVGITLSVLE
jgi:TetR/AcrR family transcriptional repressor of nem operon